jgi:hypothetical protein
MDRKEVIRRAKEDVVKFIMMEHPNGSIKFVVKRKERKVIGYIESSDFSDSTVYNKTTAKCHKDDIFNEHIGKAIVSHIIFGQPVPMYYLEDYSKENAENGDVILINSTYYVVGSHNVSIRKVAFKNYCKGRQFSLENIKGKVVDDTGYIDDLTNESDVPQTPQILSCYDRVKHECAGGCQGMCDCLLAQYFKGERETEPTKKEMRAYIEETRRADRDFRKIANDPEFKKAMREVFDKFKR